MVDNKSSRVMKALMHPLEQETWRCTTGTIPLDGRKVLARRRLDGTRRESGHAEIDDTQAASKPGSWNQTSASSAQTVKHLEVRTMGYGIAWLLGVPVSILIIWFIVSRVL